MMAALMASNALAIDMMLPAMPAMGQALQVADANHLQLMVGLFVLSSAIGGLVAGAFSDRFGRRAVLLAALPASALFGLLCMVVTSLEGLLAFRILHGFAAGPLIVVASAIVRDRFSGDRMARVMSSVLMTFMLIPILAPSLGQLVFALAGWRPIFAALAAVALFNFLWVARRLPETLDADRRASLSLRPLLRSWMSIVTSRLGLGYMLGAAVTIGPMFGFINSAAQIFAVTFSAMEWFPLGFALSAGGMGVANFVNARIVEAFGARRVSHSALCALVLLGVAQVVAHRLAPDSLPLFVTLVAFSMATTSFCSVNFGSIAMEPFGHLAGSASSVGSFIRMGVGGSTGILIGQMFDGTSAPLGYGFLGCALAAMAMVLWAEKGRLFTRPRHSALRPPFESHI